VSYNKTINDFQFGGSTSLKVINCIIFLSSVIMVSINACAVSVLIIVAYGLW